MVYHERDLSGSESRVEWWRCRELNPGLGGLPLQSTCVADLVFHLWLENQQNNHELKLELLSEKNLKRNF